MAETARDQLRLAAVRRYEILDPLRHGSLDQIALSAAKVWRGPIATVTIVDEDGSGSRQICDTLPP